jgi:signal peptidase
LTGIAQSVAACYLVARGGLLPALLYRGGIEAFRWFSPIVPDLEWTTAAFIGTLAPVFTILVVQGAPLDETPEDAPSRGLEISPAWVLPSIAVVALLWFSTGMLGVQPAVVAGVSMEPTMHAGDLVVTQPVELDELTVGDIVRFDKGQSQIVHRIIEVEQTPVGRVFVTKGDNNNTPDDPILAPQVRGKVLVTIPKLGWIPIGAVKVVQEVLAAPP